MKKALILIILLGLSGIFPPWALADRNWSPMGGASREGKRTFDVYFDANSITKTPEGTMVILFKEVFTDWGWEVHKDRLPAETIYTLITYEVDCQTRMFRRLKTEYHGRKGLISEQSSNGDWREANKGKVNYKFYCTACRVPCK
jgi:hypothetical protein